jgi:hypothetical protein
MQLVDNLQDAVDPLQPMVDRDRPPLLIAGMHGLGDNLHQRAIVSQLMDKWDVWLQTSWVSVYHDLTPLGLKLVRKRTELRFQTANQEREAHLFSRTPCPNPHDLLPIWYRPEQVNSEGSVLGAMCKAAKVDYAKADFRLPIPCAWRHRILSRFESWGILRSTKPLLVYRPLIERTEWGGCAARNPLLDVYHNLLMSLRDQFFIISVADLLPKREWISSYPVYADIELHQGELPFEELAALFYLADLVYCSPGFAAVLAEAVETPSITVFGGFETGTSFMGGARYSPHLPIAPINGGCGCWEHDHPCDKTIDTPLALQRIRQFVKEHVHASSST